MYILDRIFTLSMELKTKFNFGY